MVVNDPLFEASNLVRNFLLIGLDLSMNVHLCPGNILAPKRLDCPFPKNPALPEK